MTRSGGRAWLVWTGLVALVGGLGVAPAAHALDFDTNGWWRARYFFADGSPLNPATGNNLNTEFLDYRFALYPTLSVTDEIKIKARVDILDDVIREQRADAARTANDADCAALTDRATALPQGFEQDDACHEIRERPRLNDAELTKDTAIDIRCRGRAPRVPRDQARGRFARSDREHDDMLARHDRAFGRLQPRSTVSQAFERADDRMQHRVGRTSCEGRGL